MRIARSDHQQEVIVASVFPQGRGDWPALPYEAWKDTCETLHMYMQIVGKLRLALTPTVNQWWEVPFYLTARGMTTSPIPYGARTFEMRFDFIDHALLLETNEGYRSTLPLVPRTVADFYEQVHGMLGEFDLEVPIWTQPVEVPNGIPFDEDTVHGAYDADMVRRFWDITRQMDIIFKRFRGQFRGKCSPVHFFWGSFDLAVSRFSGRMAPPRKDADSINRIAYDEEVCSFGFWPGNDATGGPMLYSYIAPEPPGYGDARVLPETDFYSRELKEYLLPYDAIRDQPRPDAVALEFAESAYVAAATHAGWDLQALRYSHADPEPALAFTDAALPTAPP
jgi:hypothetical protein